MLRTVRRPKRLLRRVIQNLGLIVGTVLLLLIVLNFVYMALHRSKSDRPPKNETFSRVGSIEGLKHEYIPGSRVVANGVEVVINSLGFRDREYAPDKPEGVFRIVALGDSITFGQGVPLESTYPAQIEALLNEKASNPDKFQVFNAGVQGYNTLQEAVVLRQKILPLRPDLIVLGFMETNDPEIDSIEAYSMKKAMGKASALLRIPLIAYLAERIERKATAEDHSNFTHEIYRPDGAPWQACMAALQEIRDLCAENDIGLIVVLFPCLYHEDIFQAEREQLKSALASLGIPYLETFPHILDIPASDLHVSETDHHPSAVVHRRFAELIAGRIQENHRHLFRMD